MTWFKSWYKILSILFLFCGEVINPPINPKERTLLNWNGRSRARNTNKKMYLTDWELQVFSLICVMFLLCCWSLAALNSIRYKPAQLTAVKCCSGSPAVGWKTDEANLQCKQIQQPSWGDGRTKCCHTNGRFDMAQDSWPSTLSWITFFDLPDLICDVFCCCPKSKRKRRSLSETTQDRSQFAAFDLDKKYRPITSSQCR